MTSDTQRSEPDIQPCPCCGIHLFHVRSLAKSFQPPRTYHEWHHVEDNGCWLRNRMGQVILASTDDEAEYAKTIAAWNRRTTPNTIRSGELDAAGLAVGPLDLHQLAISALSELEALERYGNATSRDIRPAIAAIMAENSRLTLAAPVDHPEVVGDEPVANNTVDVWLPDPIKANEIWQTVYDSLDLSEELRVECADAVTAAIASAYSTRSALQTSDSAALEPVAWQRFNATADRWVDAPDERKTP